VRLGHTAPGSPADTPTNWGGLFGGVVRAFPAAAAAAAGAPAPGPVPAAPRAPGRLPEADAPGAAVGGAPAPGPAQDAARSA